MADSNPRDVLKTEQELTKQVILPRHYLLIRIPDPEKSKSGIELTKKQEREIARAKAEKYEETFKTPLKVVKAGESCTFQPGDLVSIKPGVGEHMIIRKVADMYFAIVEDYGILCGYRPTEEEVEMEILQKSAVVGQA